MDLISRLGYSRYSPYQNSPFLDIKSPNGLIDMSNTDIPLLGIGLNSRKIKFLRPKSGTYSFPDKVIREIPLAQTGGEKDPNKEFLTNWYTNRVITDPYIQEGFNLDKPAYLKNLQNFPEYTFVENIDPTDPNVLGRYDRQTGQLLVKNDAPEHTKLHELNHFLNSQGAGEYMRTIHKDIVANELKPKSEMKGPYAKKYDYFSDPDEIHSRIMVLRQRAGFKPNEFITSDKLSNFLKDYKWDDNNINDIFWLAKDPMSIINMLNFMAKNDRDKRLTQAKNGGPISPKDFTLQYIKSPKYRERLIKSGYSNVDEEIKNRYNSVYNTNKIITQSGPSNFFDAVRSIFTDHPYSARGGSNAREKNIIWYDPKQAKGLGATKEEILAHEFSHKETTDDEKWKPLLNQYDISELTKRLNPKGVKDIHDKMADENKADLNAVRYWLYNNGVDIFNKDITPEDLKKAMNSKKFTSNRLFRNYKFDDALWLINNIAVNNPEYSTQERKLPFAQKGLTYLEPTSLKLPRNNDRSELATSIDGENGKPAFLVPLFKYGQPILGPSNNPYIEFLRTGEHLGGPFKTWQEADEWDRNIRHPFVEKGKPIPTPYKRWGNDYTNQSSPEQPFFKFFRNGGSLPEFQTRGEVKCPPGKYPRTYQKGMLTVTECVTLEEMNSLIRDENIRGILNQDKEKKLLDEGKRQAIQQKTLQGRGDIRVNNNIRSENQLLNSRSSSSSNTGQGTISMPSETPSTLDRVLDIASNPTEAFSYLVQGRSLPTRMSGNNPYDFVFGFPGQVIRSGKNVASALFSPIETGKTLGAAGTNLLTNLTIGENLFDESYNNKALNLGLDVANVLGAKVLGKNALRLYDKNFTKVGQALNQIEREGIEQGLSKWEIAKRQMENVGITSNQRRAYTPVLSNFVYKNIYPYGYGSALEGQRSKLSELINNIRKGGIDYNDVDKARNDAWRLYLGKPQINNTFRIAETSPFGHRSYSPSTLRNIDIYSINDPITRNNLRPNITEITNTGNPKLMKKNLDMFTRNISYANEPNIMGGYNRRLTDYGLEYNDIWDLNPTITPYNFFPKPLQKGVDVVFGKKYKTGWGKNAYYLDPKTFTLDMGKFLGKPFMSHELIPEYTRQGLGNEMRQALNAEISNYKNASQTMPFLQIKLNKYQGYLDELERSLNK